MSLSFSFSEPPITSTSTSPSTGVPLTTLFTPPASCASQLLTITDPAGDHSIWSDFQVSDTATLSCYPSRISQVYGNASFYSPGICPQSWVTATALPTGLETFALCCPSGFTLLPLNISTVVTTSFSFTETSQQGLGYGTTTLTGLNITTATYEPYSVVCASTFNATTSAIYFSPVLALTSSTSLSFDIPVVVTATVTAASAVLTLPVRSGTALAHPNTVAWRSQDLSLFPNPTTSPPAAGPAGQGHLSGGTIAGIAIGSLAFVALLGGIALLFILRRRKARNSGDTSHPRHDERPTATVVANQTHWEKELASAAVNYPPVGSGGERHVAAMSADWGGGMYGPAIAEAGGGTPIPPAATTELPVDGASSRPAQREPAAKLQDPAAPQVDALSEPGLRQVLIPVQHSEQGAARTPPGLADQSTATARVPAAMGTERDVEEELQQLELDEARIRERKMRLLNMQRPSQAS